MTLSRVDTDCMGDPAVDELVGELDTESGLLYQLDKRRSVLVLSTIRFWNAKSAFRRHFIPASRSACIRNFPLRIALDRYSSIDIIRPTGHEAQVPRAVQTSGEQVSFKV